MTSNYFNAQSSTQLRTTASQKTQHGKCHSSEKLDYLSFRAKLLDQYKKELEEERKYYMGFGYRCKTWFDAYMHCGTRHLYFKLNKQDFESKITTRPKC